MTRNSAAVAMSTGGQGRPAWNVRPAANAAATMAMAISTITSSMASPPEAAPCLEDMVMPSCMLAPPPRVESWATGCCNATSN